MSRNSLLAISSLAALIAAACSDTQNAADLNKDPPLTSGGTGGSVAQVTAGSSGSPVSSTGGSGGQTVVPQAGSAGTPAAGGTGGGAGPTGGTGSSGGSGGMAPVDAYSPRMGKFKMLVYSKTAAFRHADSIGTGKAMLNAIATEIGIDPPDVKEDNTWMANIDDYELLFFMNPTGDIFTDQEEGIFETWMKKGGAFAGVHAATDTENGWGFYSEVTGQYYDLHGPQNQQGSIQFEADALTHPAVAGLPNPWQRSEEWYNFNSHQTWSAKPGFKILGRKDGVPMVWVRQHENFRSFYTAIGHDGTVFQDPAVKQHVKGGIMWAVRREHCLAMPKPAGCP
jgi:type 1 glutamine amidotransferase